MPDPLQTDPERHAVIVGVGQISDRPEHWSDGLDSLGLMEAALRRADKDAGGAWLADLDLLATVDQISCPELATLAQDLAGKIGAQKARTETTAMPHGDSPVRLLDEAANSIRRGEIRIAAIAGGEALRTAAARGRAQSPDMRPGDILRGSPKRTGSPYRQAHGLVAPTDMYPLYENACRAAWGQSLAEAQTETGDIWARMAQVAREEEGAWIRRPPTAEQIVTPSANNRWIAFPYTKLMVANASVNQGAGFIVASLAEARRRGVPEDRMVHVGYGAGAQEPYDILDREGYTRSPSMEAVLKATVHRNRISTDALDCVELYSCFPCVPKMARRILNWPLDKPVTVFGGLTFGGAPVANYMGHAIVCMVDSLRQTRGTGLAYGNGGIVTTNHAIVLSGRAISGVQAPLDPSVQAKADASRHAAPELHGSYSGSVTVETWTVHYGRNNTPLRGVIVARTPDGARTLASVPAEDLSTLRNLTDGSEVIGHAGQITSTNGNRRFAFTHKATHG